MKLTHRFIYTSLAILLYLTRINSLTCIIGYCRNAEGCQMDVHSKFDSIQCPFEAVCFLHVKITFENGQSIISELSRGCTSFWPYMRSKNGSLTCFDGPDEYRTCLCSNADMCNDRYSQMSLAPFPPSIRRINCAHFGVIRSDQSYCGYRRSVGVDSDWHRHAFATGYFALLENSSRDRLCFRDNTELDCYCKVDGCNVVLPNPPSLEPPEFVGAFDKKVKCCKGEVNDEKIHFPHSTSQTSITPIGCFSSGQDVCTGDYCFIKFKYDKLEKRIFGRQTCYNTSSELVTNYTMEISEFGQYKEGLIYCREDMCNGVNVVVGKSGEVGKRKRDINRLCWIFVLFSLLQYCSY